ncbi:MAG TPA: metal-dependent hydrolase [Caulobacteraceae bacterium]|nr:metal-dependent hydrolase [Caulobacteraceae bacterium]
MTVSSLTPTDLTISPRDRDFGRRARAARDWAQGDPVATAIMNALSATFPEGEKFFIESVVKFKDRVDGVLKDQVKAFVRQEAMHTREHIAFNNAVIAQGYDIAGIEARSLARLAVARSRHPVAQLAVTAAMEHFTALLAEDILTNPERLRGADAQTANLWKWHSIEEIEHKSVAYDVLMKAMEGLSPYRRWSIRVRIMALTTVNFVRNMSGHVADLLRQDGLDPKAHRGRALKVLFGKHGMLRGRIGAYLSYYLPGFHPWKHDNRALIAQAEAELKAAA